MDEQAKLILAKNLVRSFAHHFDWLLGVPCLVSLNVLNADHEADHLCEAARELGWQEVGGGESKVYRSGPGMLQGVLVWASTGQEEDDGDKLRALP